MGIRRKEVGHQPLDSAANIPTDTAEPIESLDQEMVTAIRDAFDALPEDNKLGVIAYLLISGNWTMQQVAELTGRSVEDSLIYRQGRKMMRAAILAQEMTESLIATLHYSRTSAEGPSKDFERLRLSELQAVVAVASKLKTEPEDSAASARDSELSTLIHQGLPESLSRRLETLIAKRQAEALTSEEHAELIRLGDEVERREASRLEALSELASVREMRLPDLMQALGPTAPSHE